MLNALFWVFKVCLFTAVVLVSSHLIEVKGRSVSDHVAAVLDRVEARRFATDLVVTSKSGLQRKYSAPQDHVSEDDQAELKHMIKKERR